MSNNLEKTYRKVTIIGAGSVGLAGAAATICTGGIDELVLIDIDAARAKGEAIDLDQAASGFPTTRCKVGGGSDYSLSADSCVIVVCAGVGQKPGQTRLEILSLNEKVIRQIIPKAIKYSPHAVVIIVSNPVDVMTCVAAEVSGLPPGRVFGSGTSLDSLRLRHILGNRYNVHPSSVEAHVLGEHGDSSVVAWSQIKIAGTKLSDFDPELSLSRVNANRDKIATTMRRSAYEILGLKHNTCWGIGYCIAQLVHAVLSNLRIVLPVSIGVAHLVDACCSDIENRHSHSNIINNSGSSNHNSLDPQLSHKYSSEISYYSIPCVIGSSGVERQIFPSLSVEEGKELEESAAFMHTLQQKTLRRHKNLSIKSTDEFMDQTNGSTSWHDSKLIQLCCKL